MTRGCVDRSPAAKKNGRSGERPDEIARLLVKQCATQISFARVASGRRDVQEHAQQHAHTAMHAQHAAQRSAEGRGSEFARGSVMNADGMGRSEG